MSVSASLTFAPGDWEVPQTVTVAVAPDLDAVADEATVSHALSGGDYEGLDAPGVVVAVIEDERPSAKVVARGEPGVGERERPRPGRRGDRDPRRRERGARRRR